MSFTPPPFNPQVPSAPKKKNVTLILVIVFVAFACLCVVPGILVYNVVKAGITEGIPMAQCALAYDDVRGALLAYAKEHDGKLPEAASWQDDVRPYYKAIASKSRDERGPIEPMDVNGPWGCTQSSGSTGMAFNSELGGVKLDEIKDPHSTPLLFEIESASPNANEKYQERPRSTGPLIMGKRRDWIVVHVEGDIDMSAGGASARIKID